MVGVGAVAVAATAATPAADRILQRTAVLASDAFEGRGPATPGEEKTIAYLGEEMRRLGLAPGNPDGTYVQAVPMVGVKSKTRATWQAAGQAVRTWEPNVDLVAPSMRLRERVELKDSEVIFLGYGVTAPEYGWDDYRGVDVRGKTVVVLVNDPPVVDPADPARLDPKVFGGQAMTYYGRWTYKYENASAHGAAACLIVHETGPAAYPFSVVVESRSRENFTLPVADDNASRVAVEGWLSQSAATELLAAAGQDFATLKRAAVQRDFRPVPLAAKVAFVVENTLRRVASKNAVGLLRGADPAHADEYIVYSSHWDHLGRDPQLAGDQIYNGALDNASGVAQILEVAQGMLALPPAQRPRRSVLFLFTTAEEKNLLGAAHYARQPLYPLERTLADINVDCANPYGPTSDVAIIGLGASSLDAVATTVARGQGRVIVPESHPEHGSYYRADHLEFARAGVPALYVGAGRRHVGRPENFAQEIGRDYLARRYHKVTDEMQPDWTMEGAARDAEFLQHVGLAIAAADAWPTWSPGNEFKARREAMRAGR